MRETQQSSRSISQQILWIAFAGFLIRLLYCWLNPRPLASDEIDYQILAVNLATHFSYAIDSVPTAFRPVGYPALVALVYFIAGVNPLAIKIVQALCDSMVVIMLPRICEGATDKMKIFTAGAWAIFPPAILYTNLVMSESLYVSLLVLACLLFVQLDSGRLRSILLGVLLGILTLIRPSTIPLFLFLAATEYFITRALRRDTIVIVSFLLTIAPWTLRNLAVVGVPTIATNTGINLLIGNNPNANGGFTAHFSREAVDSIRSETMADRQAMRLATSFISKYPGRFILNGVKKYAQFFSNESYLLVSQFSREPFDSKLPLAKRYGAISPLAFVLVNIAYAFFLVTGWLGFLTSRKNRTWYFMAGLLSSLLMVHLVVFGGNRFHYPLMPLFVLFSIQYFALPHENFSELVRWRKIAAALGILSFVCIWGTELVIVLRQ